MALLTKKEFCQLAGIKTKDLSIYVSRGKVVLNGELVNDSLDVNLLFIATHKKNAEAKVQASPEQKVQAQVETKKETVLQHDLFSSSPAKKQLSYADAVEELKVWDVKKREAEVEKLELEIQKRKGEVIPNELIKPVFIQHNQSITTEFKNAADEILRSISKKKSLTVNETAELKGELVEIINSAVKKATRLTLGSIDNIVNEFALRKGIGERN